MTFLRIVKNHNIEFDTFIKFKNTHVEFIFACQNNLLLNYYSMPKPQNDNNSLITTLSHIFSHELVKFFSTKIPGGVFEVVDVSSPFIIENNLDFVDIELPEISENYPNSFARIYATESNISEINKHILSKTVLTNIMKVTGYPIYSKQLKIDEIYNVSLLDNIRSLKNRMLFLQCSYLIENEVVDFYFPEKIVNYFCAKTLRNTNVKGLVFSSLLGKIFAELFLEYLNTTAHVFAKTQSCEVRYIKDKDFLEFNLVSDESKRFEFFADMKHKLFIVKLLTAMQFLPNTNENQQNKQGNNVSKEREKPQLKHLKLPFAAELGVTYLSQSEYKNLTEGDIIVFDKTCLSTETMSVDKCVINLNGLNAVATLQNNSCELTHFTKDW